MTGEPVGPAPMRLRAEPPRVTRLSRKVLAGLGLVASVGLGGALIYALQTRD
ncbi:conjugal transfer protein TraI, partial [Enterobacter kobei]